MDVELAPVRAWRACRGTVFDPGAFGTSREGTDCDGAVKGVAAIIAATMAADRERPKKRKRLDGITDDRDIAGLPWAAHAAGIG